MIILVLKAQSNHFSHLDEDLRNEINMLRKDMDLRFEQVDKQFEQISCQFNLINSRLDILSSMIMRSTLWSFTRIVSAAGLIIAAQKLLT